MLSPALYTVIKFDEVHNIAGRWRSGGCVVVTGRHRLGGTDRRGRQRYESTTDTVLLAMYKAWVLFPLTDAKQAGEGGSLHFPSSSFR